MDDDYKAVQRAASSAHEGSNDEQDVSAQSLTPITSVSTTMPSNDGHNKEEQKVQQQIEDINSSSAGFSKKEISDRRWKGMFLKLKRYREKTGHCRVPNRFAEDPPLGAWVATQRRFYKMKQAGDRTSPLTAERKKLLEEIGFEWSAEITVPWTSRFVELLEFVVKNGHAQVPIGWEENVPLSNWVSTQRQEYKAICKGRQSKCLNEERVRLLNSIGFVWKAQRGGPRRERKSDQGIVPQPTSGGECDMPAAAVAAAASNRRLTAQTLLRVFRRSEENNSTNEDNMSDANVLAAPDTSMHSSLSQVMRISEEKSGRCGDAQLGDSSSHRGHSDFALMSPSFRNPLGLGSSALFSSQGLQNIGAWPGNIHPHISPGLTGRVAGTSGLLGSVAGSGGLDYTLLPALARTGSDTASLQLMQARAYQQALGAAGASAAIGGQRDLQVNLPFPSTSLLGSQTRPRLPLNNPSLAGLSPMAQLHMASTPHVRSDPSSSMLLEQLLNSQNSQLQAPSSEGDHSSSDRKNTNQYG